MFPFPAFVVLFCVFRSQPLAPTQFARSRGKRKIAGKSRNFPWKWELFEYLTLPKEFLFSRKDLRVSLSTPLTLISDPLRFRR